jgi:dTDP-4-dehydrorhamnose 3,5-epimerase
VSVIKGAVWDVAVDIRLNSPTYGKFVAYELNENNKWQLYIPPGFAHGFLTLEDNTIFSYKCTGYYHKDSEQCILWNDPTLAIPWKENNPIISEKDRKGVLFLDFLSKFAIK